MYYIIGNETQYREFKQMVTSEKWDIPESIIEKIREKTAILDEFYGSDRNLSEDLGGYCIVFPSAEEWSEEEYQQIMMDCKLQKDFLYEFFDKTEGCSVWCL